MSTVGKVEAGIAAATAQDTAKCLQGASRFRSVCAWSSRARLKFPASIALTSKERSLTKRLTRGESPGKVWSAHEIERGKTFAQFERRLISQRTRAALARTRAQGVRLGRPPTMSPYAVNRIRTERAAGNSLAAIANGLNADRIPTAQGGRRWYPATVRYTLNRAQ